MDPMVALALVGTARQAQTSILSGTPVDELCAELPVDEIERRLLLNAGAAAIYRQAGIKVRESVDLPEPAAAETLRVCASSSATLLLADLLHRSFQHPALLVEATELMRQKGLCLPYELLPLALSCAGSEARAALPPVLGERGRWLSQFNPAWQWVAQQAYLPGNASGLPEDAETIWQEGTLGQRVEILRRVRAVDPAQARMWLEGVWKQEKAEARCTFLKVLENDLSADDEALLEKALDDRASSVRAEAIALLRQLPASAFSLRMQARGTAMLKMANGKLGLELPAEFGSDWERDGLSEKPSEQIGQRAWWLIQVLAAIPPTFWENHFNATPAELLQRLPAPPWQVTLIEGWSRAAVTYRVSNWSPALWSWWAEYQRTTPKKEQQDVSGITKRLLTSMPGLQAEKVMLDSLKASEHGPSDEWCELLLYLPRPWSADFAQVYLTIMRERYALAVLEKLDAKSRTQDDPWLHNLMHLAMALPILVLAQAVKPWKFPETTLWPVHYVRQRLQEFTEIVRIRKKIQKELV